MTAVPDYSGLIYHHTGLREGISGAAFDEAMALCRAIREATLEAQSGCPPLVRKTLITPEVASVRPAVTAANSSSLEGVDFLLRHIRLALEEMGACNFNSAAERLRHTLNDVGGFSRGEIANGGV